MDKPFADWVLHKLDCCIEITSYRQAAGVCAHSLRLGCNPNFSWSGKFGRPNKDYEALPESIESQIYAAMTGNGPSLSQTSARPMTFGDFLNEKVAILR